MTSQHTDEMRKLYDKFKKRIGYKDDPIIEPAIRHAFCNGCLAATTRYQDALREALKGFEEINRFPDGGHALVISQKNIATINAILGDKA